MTDRKELEDAIKSEVARGQFSLMNDELFRYVFGREESRDITAEFLSAGLEKDFGHRISGISFRPALELPVRSDLDQVSRFMARCELGGEDHIFVELQLVNFMESKNFPLICCAMMIDAQPEDDLHPLFVEALQRKSYTEYLLDSFLDGSPEERWELVAQQGKEVMKLEQRIAEWTAAGTLHRGTGQKQPGTDRER